MTGKTKSSREKKPVMPLTWEYENAAYDAGYTVVCGCDEAGRGPLAGSVVAAAVVLPRGMVIPGLNDSKKLSEKKREALYDIIRETALAYAIAETTAKEIDEINILNAAMLAMSRAVDAIRCGATDGVLACEVRDTGAQNIDFALIDGNTSRYVSVATQTVVGGDGKSPSIAAASVLAKVTRDRMCLALDADYPVYGFAKHKGYPTKAHMDAVREYGPAPCHRRTFLKFPDGDES